MDVQTLKFKTVQIFGNNGAIRIMCILLRLKSCSARGASHYSVFMWSGLTISHTFLALPTQWMNSPSRISEHGIGPRLNHIVLVFGLNQENYEAGEVQDSLV